MTTVSAVSSSSDSSELFRLLESTNEAAVEEIKALIHENLNQTKEPSYLNSLVDFYMSSGCHKRCQDILVGIREPHDKHLFDKLSECFKGSTRFKAFTLLGHIVHKQPSWLYKISQHSLLHSLIKILKNDTEIPNVMSGVLIIVTLLPIIPSSVGTHLNDIFEIFTRMSSWHAKRPSNIPETFLMHLHVATYALFHRLYSMYPCNFLSYLRTYCNSNTREHLLVFRESIRPMLDCVRMHPMLVTFTKEAEVSMTRWKAMETHDIVVECAKLSLDPIEGTREVQSTFGALHSNVQNFRYSMESGSVKYANIQGSSSKVAVAPVKDSIVGQAIAEPLPAWSPSFSCELSTPPPFQAITQRESPQLDSFQNNMGDRQQGRNRARTFSGSPTPYQGFVPPSPLKIDGSHFKFPIVEANVKIGHGDAIHSKPNVVAPTPLKLTRIPLSKSGLPAPSALNRMAQKADERQQFKVSEKDDQTDSEVASIIEGISSNPSSHCWDISSNAAHTRETPISHRPSPYYRSGRGSAQWCQSPYFESLQDMQRMRSYSQGKKIPRRATIEVTSRRGSLTARSRSMPDLRPKATAAAEENDSFLEACKRGANASELLPDSILNMPFNEKQPTFPYEHLFRLALPKTTQESSCQNCLNVKSSEQQSMSASKSTMLASSVPLFVQMTPPEMLDRYLQLCDSVHEMKMNAPPQSGKDNHFQSKDKMEDPRVLNGQLQLLHIQLLYERHKREIHAERNRRLLGKAKRVKALEEQNSAMKDQMQLLEKEIATLSEVSIALSREKQQAIDQKNEEIQAARKELRSITQGKLLLEKSVQELNTSLHEAIAESCVLRKDLAKAQAEIFNTHHELEAIQEQVAQNAKLKLEIEKLSRELLLTTELNQKYQEKINVLQNSHHYDVEMATLRETYTHEMHNLHVALQNRDAHLESTKSRLSELENLLVKKDIIIAEQKRLLKASKEEYEHQIKAVEDKHNAKRLICHHLESDFLKLYQKMEKLRAEGSQQLRSKEILVKKKSNEKIDTLATSKTDMAKGPVQTKRDDQFQQQQQQQEAFHVDAGDLILPESTHSRRASEPIDIEPSFMGLPRSRKATPHVTQTEDDADIKFNMPKEILNEERISGALEPITSQSLASIIDIEEACN